MAQTDFERGFIEGAKYMQREAARAARAVVTIDMPDMPEQKEEAKK